MNQLRCPSRTKIILLAPTMIMYIVFLVMPLFIAVRYSFTDFSGIGKAVFSGVDNYMKLAEDRLFLVSLKNTMIIMGLSGVGLLVGSFIVALVLNEDFPGNTLSKAMIFAPYVIAPIIVGLIWGFILNPEYGLINSVLRKLGLESLCIEWIGGTKWTPVAVSMVFFWQLLGFHATIFLAGIKTIPGDLYEAASIDGCSRSRSVFLITIPLLKETIIMNVILIITGVFKIYELVVQLTGGGPNHLSDTLVSYMYYVVFTSSRYGYGMAIAVFILVISMCVSFFYLRISRNRGKEAAS